MDFSRPYRALIPTLDGPVLRAVAGSEGALTRPQILALANEGSEAGVRKVLNRLVEQGVVIEQRVGSFYTYQANRDHLTWPAVEILVSAHDRLDDRIKRLVGEWKIQPLSVELFGSVATGESTSASDIDLMVVSPHIEDDQAEPWDLQIDDLRNAVERWTGNTCEVLVMDPLELVRAKANGEPTLDSKRVSLAGDRIDAMVPSNEIAQILSMRSRKSESAGKMLNTPEIRRLIKQMNR